MKTKHFFNLLVFTSLLSLFFVNHSFAQDQQSIAIISIDTKGLNLDNVEMGNLVRLELEKTNKFEVLDKYDVSDIMEANSIDISSCFGKSKLVKVGKLLKADKMLTGSAEKFGDKIIFILRMIDVSTEKIEKTKKVSLWMESPRDFLKHGVC